MDLRQYLSVLRERWRLIVLCFVVGAGAAAGLTYAQQPVYSARAQLFITNPLTSDNLQQAYQGSQLGQQRVISYADIVTSPDVIAQVKDSLHLPDSISSIQSKISASAPLNTVLLNISATDTSALVAQEIANSTANAFAAYVVQLETPAGSTQSPVKATVTRTATLPSAPISPKKALDLALGILVGLAVGVIAAFLRHQLDTRIKVDTALEGVVTAPLLVTVEDDPTAKEHPTVLTGDPFGPRSEAFRTLRTNLGFVSVAEGARCIVVSSSLPGEGKTSTSINLAIAYAQSGKRTLLVDADLRRPTIADILGLNPSVGLTSVLLNPGTLNSAVQVWQEDLPFDVLVSGPTPPNPAELLGSERMHQLLDTLTSRYDVVICDSPPLLPVTDAAVLAAHADGVVLVARVGSTKREQLHSAAEAVQRTNAALLGVVLNRAPRRGKRSERYYRYYYAPTARTGGAAHTATAELSSARSSGRPSDSDTTPAPSPAEDSARLSPQLPIMAPAGEATPGLNGPANLDIQAARAITAEDRASMAAAAARDRRQRRHANREARATRPAGQPASHPVEAPVREPVREIASSDPLGLGTGPLETDGGASSGPL